MGDLRIKSQVGRVDGNFPRDPDPTAASLKVHFGWPRDTAWSKRKKKKNPTTLMLKVHMQ